MNDSERGEAAVRLGVATAWHGEIVVNRLEQMAGVLAAVVATEPDNLIAAVLNGGIDAAVVAADLLPAVLPEGVNLVAFPVRDDPRDVLIAGEGMSVADLPTGATVGVNTRRRLIQLRLARPDLEPVDLSDATADGSLSHLDGSIDALILAATDHFHAGRDTPVAEYLPVEQFIPAPGQGALAVICRGGDRTTRLLLAEIDDVGVRAEVEAERAFLAEVGGNGDVPVAAHAQQVGDRVRMWCMYADEAMERIALTEDEDDLEDSAALGRRLAEAVRLRVEG